MYHVPEIRKILYYSTLVGGWDSGFIFKKSSMLLCDLLNLSHAQSVFLRSAALTSHGHSLEMDNRDSDNTPDLLLSNLHFNNILTEL